VAGYVDQGGSGIIQAALDTGAFDTFVFPDGMVGQALVDNFGSDIDGSFGQNPGTDSEGARSSRHGRRAGFDGTSPFSAESYDAAALIMLAMQAAGSTDPAITRARSWTSPTRPAADPARRAWHGAGDDRQWRGRSTMSGFCRGTDRTRRIRRQLPRDRDRGR
jgi:hypothetical protein